MKTCICRMSLKLICGWDCYWWRSVLRLKGDIWLMSATCAKDKWTNEWILDVSFVCWCSRLRESRSARATRDSVTVTHSQASLDTLGLSLTVWWEESMLAQGGRGHTPVGPLRLWKLEALAVHSKTVKVQYSNIWTTVSLLAWQQMKHNKPSVPLPKRYSGKTIVHILQQDRRCSN